MMSEITEENKEVIMKTKLTNEEIIQREVFLFLTHRDRGDPWMKERERLCKLITKKGELLRRIIRRQE